MSILQPYEHGNDNVQHRKCRQGRRELLKEPEDLVADEGQQYRDNRGIRPENE
jgi:hypothetical protein